jgi:hypothetical protein
MKKSLNLKDYILKLNNWIPETIVKQTKLDLENDKNWKRHTYSDSKNSKILTHNGEKELSVIVKNDITYFNEIHDFIWKALEKYIVKDKIGGDTFSGWSGFTTIRYNRYMEGQLMDKHSDHIHTIFDGERKGIPILSILGSLNNDYEGGEFIMFDDYKIDLKAGDVLIWPSVFLYEHRVEPLKKGIRYSFVSWCW